MNEYKGYEMRALPARKSSETETERQEREALEVEINRHNNRAQLLLLAELKRTGNEAPKPDTYKPSQVTFDIFEKILIAGLVFLLMVTAIMTVMYVLMQLG